MEHRSSSLYGPSEEQLNQHLALWSDAGWELVTVTHHPLAERAGPSPVHSYYTLFWRRAESN